MTVNEHAAMRTALTGMQRSGGVQDPRLVLGKWAKMLEDFAGGTLHVRREYVMVHPVEDRGILGPAWSAPDVRMWEG